MAKAAGRAIVIAKGGTPIAGVTNSGIKWSGGGIEVTDRDSAGLREFLNGTDLESQSLTISVEGMEVDEVIRDLWTDPTADKMLTDLTFKFADGSAAKDTIGGDFLLVDYDYKGDHKGAVEFSATFESSGAWSRS